MDTKRTYAQLRTSRTVMELGDAIAPLLDEFGIDAIEDIHVESGMPSRFDSRADVQVVACGNRGGEHWAVEIYLHDGQDGREAYIFPVGEPDPLLAPLGLDRRISLGAGERVRDELAARLQGF